MPEEVEADDAVAARGHLGAEALHAPVHQQPVDQHQHAVALAVHLVGEVVPVVVAERGHDPERLFGAQEGATAAGSDGARSHGREARSAPRIARVAGALLSV